MTEEQKKKMLNGIINNGEKWECRPTIPCCNYNCGTCNDDGDRCAFFNDLSKMPTCASYSTGNTTKESEWQPYKLGDEIHADWEYREIEIWYVMYSPTNPSGYYYNCIWNGEDTKYFESTSKEECEKWIEEHTKKTWLEERKSCLSVSFSKEVINGYSAGAKEICKKILEEYKKLNEPTGFIKGLIKDLGVKL